jgi:hypothetical protein
MLEHGIIVPCLFTFTASQSCSPSVCTVSSPTSMELRSTIAARLPLRGAKKEEEWEGEIEGEEKVREEREGVEEMDRIQRYCEEDDRTGKRAGSIRRRTRE